MNVVDGAQKIYGELEDFAITQLKEVIMPFWRTHMPDHEKGGFYGQINDDLSIETDAPKGLVLNARILWTFSAVYGKLQVSADLDLAKRAYDYLMRHFHDKEYGGFYWSLHADGNPAETKKQIYAQAFTIYGLSEYYKITREAKVLEEAIHLYQLIEKYAFDIEYGGYIEACTREWGEIENLQLSPKDMNEKKSQNTHLHVLEAYSNLYGVWPDPGLKTQLEKLIGTFTRHILDASDSHLILFFDEKWTPKSSLISFGHDIEGSWLLHEAALVSKNEELIAEVEQVALRVIEAASEGYLESGAMRYEDDRAGKHRDDELEWWAQAEAVVGYLNGYVIGGNEEHLERAHKIMLFIDRYIADRDKGEWFFRVDQSGQPIRSHEKAGFWKCPYHNARACLEILHRLELLRN